MGEIHVKWTDDLADEAYDNERGGVMDKTDPVALWVELAGDGLTVQDAAVALYAHAKREGMLEAAGICKREVFLCPEDEEHDNNLARKVGEGTSFNLGVAHCEQAILRAAEEVK